MRHAYSQSLLYSDAVFTARNMLNLEVHDGELSSARLMNPNIVEIENKLLIYPNPAHNTVWIKLSNSENVNSIIVADITGRIVLMNSEVEIINTSFLSQGLYFVKVTHDDENYFSNFIISR